MSMLESTCRHRQEFETCVSRQQEPSQGRLKISRSSKVRLAGKNIARLVVEDETAVLYHCMHNDRETHASGTSEEGLVRL